MNKHQSNKSILHLIGNLLVIACLLVSFLPTARVAAADPTSVTIASSFQSELGCSGDWKADCGNTHLTYDSNDDVWQGIYQNNDLVSIPAGNWEYKAALNDSWDENYGQNAVLFGDNISLSLALATKVKFYYDHKTHWVTDNLNSIIATAAGSFQSELGCSIDWDPSCLRSWLEDPAGNGIFTFETTAIPPGNYEAKVAINEDWGENYGAGGIPDGANIPFSVVASGSAVTFSYTSSTHVLTINVREPGPQLDNDVWWDGLSHDSRDTLYRTPGGAVPSGTPVTLRFRTFHNDVNKVQVRIYDINTSAQHFENMQLAASDVSCYQPGLLYNCDFWQVTLPNSSPDNLWYRFLITDGTKTVYYADDTPALDGGLGSTSNDPLDYSYALMIYDPAFTAPSWAQKAVIYQIFPDRFRNGRTDNDPKTGDIRYADPVIKLPWGTLPEGYCRNYLGANPLNCPWRFGVPPTGDPNATETPYGRDYMGGDLKGVDQNLDYLVSLGVNTLYFNPIFDSGSNHGYDTQDYFKIDPYFGTQKDWNNLVKHANQLGVRIILDGVYNHMSSDSPFFDRYHHYTTVGACESTSSPYRNWFTFHDVAPGDGTCVGSAGPNSATYDGWFGFDSIPVLNKSNPDVQAYFLTNNNSVARYWLVNGASGWRLDVMGDSSFPTGYWESFRQVVKNTSPNTLIIGELWQKDSTQLRFLRGDRADTTMNYRLRDIVLGLLAPQAFDPKGFADGGRILKPSEFASRLASIREDYPDAAFYSLMNLLGTHDTARQLWILTPGDATRADKEFNLANLSVGKLHQKLASLIQFTLPGAPTIYYGDEVGVTGNDDPDDRRTYPWLDQGGTPDMTLFAHYKTLASLRKQNDVLTSGDLRMLLADDDAGTLAYGRKTTSQAALVVINRSDANQTVSIPLAGYIPDGVKFKSLYGVGNTGSVSATVTGGQLSVTLQPWSAWLLATSKIDLQPPKAPTNLQAVSGNAKVDLSWDTVNGAAGYNLYRSPVSGGGYVKIAALTGSTFTDTDVLNGKSYYYVATALDGAGNESANSNEVLAVPALSIGYAVLQWPKVINQVITANYETVYGQVYIAGLTDSGGDPAAIQAQLGFGAPGSNPETWSWQPMTYNSGHTGDNNFEYMAGLRADAVGTYDYLVRFSDDGGLTWVYGDQDGYTPSGSSGTNMPGVMTITASSDTTSPTAPIASIAFDPSSVTVSWTASTDPDDTVAEYRIYRGGSAGAEGAAPIAIVSGSTLSYVDMAVVTGQTYYYIVKAFDTSLNASDPSNEVSAAPDFRTVTLTFNVTVPLSTDATAMSVSIAGTLSRLDGGLPDWAPGSVVMTRVDATHWTIELTGKEFVQIAYKYVLKDVAGDWLYVEKDGSCGEIADRTLTLSYGSTGTMIINDTVLNWRNVPPCGN